MLHVLKCWPAPFEAVKQGVKRVEIRKDDRGYEVGDILRLLEYNPETESFTNSDRAKEVVVTHIVRGGRFGLAEGHVALSIKPHLPERKIFTDILPVILQVVFVLFLVCFFYFKLSPAPVPPPCNCICEKRVP